ncbi:MAG: hypothetical protein GX289_10405 [Tissierellia bacterium]|jgi:REP element-mobilizing transposase RayT|nr:hypothetical protein [Tissierellia bacterium]
MGRKPRIEFNGALYHVIQRGNNKEYVFKNNADKKHLLGKLKEFKEMMDFEIYGYVLMDNHYHIVIRCRETIISNIMHRVNNDYGKYYNISYKRTGHVFQDRYKGLLVKDDKNLLSLLRYVHQNPVKANMCRKVTDYFWSSDSSYRKNLTGKLVDIDFVLNIFSLDRAEAINEYIKFMDSSKLEESKYFEEINIIGENTTSGRQTDASRPTLDEILRGIANNEEDIVSSIKSGSRKRSLSGYKKLFVMKSLSENYTLKEIGNNIGISESAVCLIANKD